MEPYIELYQNFMKEYSRGTTTSEEVGELIAHLAGFYPNYNAAQVRAERGYALVCRDEVLKTDETSGKAISSAKAETIANASIESSAYKQARMHVENLEMLIQSAKALQRGLIQEMSHAGL
jgi:hypothetical protein